MQPAPCAAFYAPMKSPNHPTPSGDREMARMLIKALRGAGFAPDLASEFRAYRRAPEQDALEEAARLGEAEAAKVIARYQAAPPHMRPKLWFTYHCYYKAPDYLGPRVAAALGVPYVVAEASRSERRLKDAWSYSALYAESAIDLADVVLCLTNRDRPALEAKLRSKQSLLSFPPFVEAGPPPPAREAPKAPLQFATVAMMRPGAKFESYQLLAQSLQQLLKEAPADAPKPFELSIYGDGPMENEVRALFAPFGTAARFLGRLEGAEARRAAYQKADCMIWPGVDEAFGMVYLEAQAAGAPVVAQDRPGVRDVVRAGGLLAPLDHPNALGAYAAAMCRNEAAWRAHREAGRRRIVAEHSLEAAALRLWKLGEELGALPENALRPGAPEHSLRNGSAA